MINIDNYLWTESPNPNEDIFCEDCGENEAEINAYCEDCLIEYMKKGIENMPEPIYWLCKEYFKEFNFITNITEYNLYLDEWNDNIISFRIKYNVFEKYKKNLRISNFGLLITFLIIYLFLRIRNIGR